MKNSTILVKILFLILFSGYSTNTFSTRVAFFPFNGNANDSTSNNHDGIVSGATLTTDRFGKANSAYSFNGSSDFIEITSVNSLKLPEYTYEAWFNIASLPSGSTLAKGAATILDIGSELGDQVLNVANYIGVYYGISGFGYYVGGGTYNTQNDVLPALNQWYHVVGTRSATHYKLYVNGSLIQSVQLLPKEPEYDISTKAYIGKRIGDLQYFEGKIDDIGIYNEALTEAQVKSRYLNESLVAYYPFNSNANDESGNGNHGTITGPLVTPVKDRYGEEGKAYKFWFPDYVSVPTNSSFFTDEFTVSYWHKVEAYWGLRSVISCVGNKGGYQQVFDGTSFTYLLGYNFPAGSWFWTNYVVPNAPNGWQQITVCYKKTGDNKSITKLYLNGELKSSDTYDNFIAYPGSEILYIGKNHSELGFNGELDDFRFYNRMLTDNEIMSLHLAELPNNVKNLNIQKMYISPNPNNGKFQVNFGLNYPKIQLTFSDITGKVLKSIISFDVQNLNMEFDAPSGVYFLKIDTGHDNEILKLIKK